MKGINVFLLIILTLLLFSCGVKLEEDAAHGVMGKIYAARKKGSFYKEFRYYDKESFKIVPFNDVVITLKTVVGGAGRFKSAKHLSTKISRRNQINEGLISYMVLTYKVKYARLELTESYYFLGSDEKPRLVYMTLQF
jgi:hypothetical protein